MYSRHRGRGRWLAALALVPAAAAAEPVRLTPQQAVRLALRQNLSLRQQRLDPALTTAAERAADAAFDPTLFSSADVAGSPGSVSASRVGLAPASSTSVGGELGLRKLFSIGTSVEGRVATTALFGGGKGGLDPAYESSLQLSARQALLQGISRAANEAPIELARHARESAAALLRREAELVAADTLKAYWDLRAAVAKVSIQGVALGMAEQTLRETEAMIGAGKQPASERASAVYTVQRQRRSKLQAEQELANVRDRMARLLGVVGPSSLATPELLPVSTPRRTPPRWTLADLQRRAIASRGDYRAILVAIKMRRSDELVAKHKLLPKLDLIASLQLSGLSGESAPGSSASGDDYGSSYWSSYALKRVGWSAGLAFELPIGRAEAKARREIAGLQLKRAELTAEVALQALSLELNLAWRALQLARQQLRLTEEAARVAETKLANETERYKAGKITAHILSSVQAEVITERLGREQSLADLVKAVVEMQSAAGVLLERLGMSAEGEAAAGATKEAGR
jgi:outer membrane protein TolC